MSTSALIVLAVIVVGALWVISVYNQRVNQAFADVDVQLRQRHDLIPNLVQTANSAAGNRCVLVLYSCTASPRRRDLVLDVSLSSACSAWKFALALRSG
jgi:hypothetical protein